MTTFKTTRQAAGSYTVTDGKNSVEVSGGAAWGMDFWTAFPEWDTRHGDGFETKAGTVAAAKRWLAEKATD